MSKNRYLIYLLLPLFTPILAQHQYIEIQQNQTSHLVFPSDIKYLDIGDTENFLTDYTNNILRVKGVKTVHRTNLTVVTQDDYYYSFFVVYDDEPKLNYFIEKKHSITQIVTKEETNPTNHQPEAPIANEILPPVLPLFVSAEKAVPKKTTLDKGIPPPLLYQKAQSLLEAKNKFDYVNAKHGDILLKVTGIYHSLDNCFIRYQIRNKGIIPYDVQLTTFGIKDKKRQQQSTYHVKDLPPLLVVREEQTRVLPKRTNTYIAVFEKIALPKGKQLYMEVIENGRNLYLPIPYNQLPIERL